MKDTPNKLNLEKRGIRGMTIAESYTDMDDKSTLAGIIMRNDNVIDGFVAGYATIHGNDSTDSILQMYNRARRTDISYMLVWGTIISRYNTVDINRISECLGMPVLGISGMHKKPINDTLRVRLPEIHTIKLQNSHTVYAHVSGCTKTQAENLLNIITIQGGIPEPVRLARLLAVAIRQHTYRLDSHA